MRPIPLPAAGIVSNTGNGANLADPQPKVAWQIPQSAGAWASAVIIDLGADRSFDTVALIATNASQWLFWSFYSKTAAQGPFSGLGETAGATAHFVGEIFWTPPTVEGALRHGVRLILASTGRYLQFVVGSNVPGSDASFRAGCLLIGQRIQPGGPLGGFDWGGGRRVLDLSAVRVLQGGERAIWKGTKVPEVRGTFSHLSDSELQRLWQLQLLVGESEPVLLVEAPDTGGPAGGNERIHYGLLTGLDFFERRQSDKSRVEVRLQHWL